MRQGSLGTWPRQTMTYRPRWTRLNALSLGGGGATAERTSIYLDAADVAQATFLSASFDEEIVSGYEMEFVLFNGGASGDRRGYVTMTSDEFLLLTAQATAPTDTSEAQGFLVRQPDLSGTSTSPANTVDIFNVWQGATATDFYYRAGRSGNFRLQVYQVHCRRANWCGRRSAGTPCGTALVHAWLLTALMALMRNAGD